MAERVTRKEALQIGSRTLLRAPALEDRDEFLRLARASARLHRGWVTAPQTDVQYRSMLDRCRGESTETFLVCRRDDGAQAGVFNLSQIFRGNFLSCYMGYYAWEPLAGQGYMGEGLELVLRQAFAAMKLHRIEANIQPGNERSIALVRRAGFTLEGFSRRYLKIGGRWRDHERWAIIAEDWRASRRR